MAKKSPLEILRTVFGYASFRGDQETVIQTLVDGHDALVFMPTGGGKSLCYQIPSMVRDGVGIVISPLIALMEDQVTALREAGVAAAYLNSSLAWPEVKDVEQKLLSSKLNLLYVAPERLVQPSFLELIKSINIALFAIDEAHCVSQWGHDFRPEYLQLDILHTQFPKVPRIALTATADQTTQKEIIKRLNMEAARVFSASFDRPNIQYRIVEKQSPKKQLLAFIREYHANDAGIVYCMSRKSVDKTAAWLTEQGFCALPYHAGLSAAIRKKNQHAFLQNEGVIMVATIAFGMGIDKPNVRFVAHVDLPKSVEAYYQETGRAGRDGLKATAWLTYGIQDVVILRQMVEESKSSEAQKRVEARKLDAMLGLCETTSCRRKVLLKYFGENLAEDCQNCDTCLHPIDTWDATLAVQKALSAVYRTGESFGVGHMIDVLLGKATPKATRFRHERLAVFGVGQDLSAKRWQSIFRQLVAMGHLNIDIAGFGALQLTPACKSALRGEHTILLRTLPEAVRDRKPKLKPAVVSSPSSRPHNALFDALKSLRLKLSRDLGVPPYVIFHDRTLEEMAQHKPQNSHELQVIYGVGEHKLQKYGQAFLDVITNS